jgi:hypothetical protein
MQTSNYWDMIRDMHEVFEFVDIRGFMRLGNPGYCLVQCKPGVFDADDEFPISRGERETWPLTDWLVTSETNTEDRWK